MKYNQYITILALSVALCTACSTDDATNPAGGKLCLLPSVEEMKLPTKSTGNVFFKDGYTIDLEIKTTSGITESAPESFTYAYKNGVFTGKEKSYHFHLDDSYISLLTAKWPTAEARKNFPTDQRKEDDYRKADWLIAEAKNISGIATTDAPVPLTFTHEKCRLEFEVAGQNANGLKITDLILELQDLAGNPAAYRAYCGNANGHAELILEPGIKLESVSEYLIGRITLSDKTDYTGTIIIPSAIDITLQAGTSYLVTLTPRGYDLIASIHIGGFGQDEEGIGVPFQKPTLNNTEGIYEIHNVNQLITLSYLLRHYENDGVNVDEIDWKAQKYVLMSNITVDEATWIKMPKVSFDYNSTCTVNEKSGVDADRILFK